LAPLTDVFREAGMEMAIETSGVYELTGSWHWVCFSPKKFKKPVDSIYHLANELKVVIFHPSDFSWAEEHAARVNADCKLYLQPEWSKSDVVLPLIVDYVKKNPKWNISLQTHKYMNIP
jgi:organic radical activating enzyme